MTQVIFNEAMIQRHWDRAPHWRAHRSGLYPHAMQALIERLGDRKQPYRNGLVIGCLDTALLGPIHAHIPQLDTLSIGALSGPYPQTQYDIIISCFHLHLYNDIPRLLQQWKAHLAPGGVLLGALWGEETLYPLQQALARSYIALDRPLRAHIAPMIDIKSLGQLLAHAGFDYPVTDKDRYEVGYASLHALCHDLRAMGQTNAMMQHPAGGWSRGFLRHLEEEMRRDHPNETGIICSFDCLTFHAIRG